MVIIGTSQTGVSQSAGGESETAHKHLQVFRQRRLLSPAAAGSMLEDALAAVALERDAVAAAFADHRRLVNTFRRWTPSLRRKLTEKQQRGVQGVQRRQAYRLAAAVLVVWSRRTKAKRRADRVLARITGAVDRKRARRQLRCWRDGARRAMRAERAVTYSMLVVVRRCPPSTRHRTPVCLARFRRCAGGARELGLPHLAVRGEAAVGRAGPAPLP